MNRLLRPEIAFWRFQQIEEVLDLPRGRRAAVLRKLAQVPVKWPNGRVESIGFATFYRWIRAFLQRGLAGLQPRERRDRGQPRRPFPGIVIDEAITQLAADPEMTLTFLLALLDATFNKDKPDAEKVRIPRSTLQRRLRAHPGYRRIQRARKSKRRTRFVARAPHDMWQLDAKGPVRVRLVSGREITFHVLTVIDDASRDVLCAIVTPHADLAAAVRAFRKAAARYGVPKAMYCDKASIFDSKAFRQGLAQLGAYRIPTKARNPPARGKVEAYHRVLVSWFTKRLPRQAVVDLEHLQQLLDGMIGALYRTHYHRSIRTTPEKALAGRTSERFVPPKQLFEAFRQHKRLKAHPKTGEVVIGATTYLVPEADDDLRGQYLDFLVDPPGEIPPVVIDPRSGHELPLHVAAVKPGDLLAAPEPPIRWGAGPLQAIYDKFTGQSRPLGEPGFGLPEIYALLGEVTGRHVPATDAEATVIQRAYRDLGPLPRTPTEQALRTIASELGKDRPIRTYLDALRRRVIPQLP